MTRQALPPGWKVPEVFRQRLGSSVGRQRLMQAEGQLLLVLHAVPHANETSRTGHYFWKDADGQWHSSQLGSGVGALTKFVAQYDHAIDRVEELEENASQAEDYLNVLEELSPIARSSRNMLLVLEDARNAASEDVGLIDIRDQAYEASRTAELLYADVKNAMDVAIVRQAERQAAASAKMTQAAHRLNVLAAMFFPAATLGAIFGTTFTDGWESLSNSWMPFGIFVGASFLTGLILVAFINRKVKS